MGKQTVLLNELLQLPEVISLVERLKKGEVLSLKGMVEAGKPLLALLLSRAANSWFCLSASSIKQQEYLYSELAALTSVLFPSLSILHFPEMESPGSAGILPDPEARAEILTTLLRMLQCRQDIQMLVTTQKASSQNIPTPQTLRENIRILRVGSAVGMETLLEELVARGYENEIQVSGRGQFAQRGGILDLFPFHGETPIRVEFNGDTIESMRLFDLETQMSVTLLEEAELSGFDTSFAKKETAKLDDYFPGNHLLWHELSDSEGTVEVRMAHASGAESPVVLEIFGHDYLSTTLSDAVMQEQRYELLLRHWRDWVKEGWRVVVCCNNEGEEMRLRELMAGGVEISNTTWLQTPLLHGFIWPSAKLVLLSDAEIFGRYQTLRMVRLQKKSSRARFKREALDFGQFNEGDLVVHVHHGIGRFLGIRKVEPHGQEVLTLEYEGDALLHVPLEQAYLVGRYVGIGKLRPSLDRLGGSRWGKTAAQAQRAIVDYAAQLLKVHAERKTFNGFAFAPDNKWQKEFEDAFLFEETPDQETAIVATKEDMESEKPMDRLICGDVGFGKTEVAVRAAFKAVMSGKQVVVLAPTTVLAQQHERTFKERMADYPVQIDLLSRFRSKAQQRKTLTAAREGAVDILIGTHRLLQPDVKFKDLGLVVVDEEQRFGVKHKERFKETFKQVDILTLSATPIPRTLYLSLVGARDISTIETPPPNRLPVETMITAYDERLIRSAIERELARGGQVYFLHNRVQSIQRVRDRILELVPSAVVEIGHGQMDEDELEAVMMRFVAGETGVLVATTIIESGLDIPRANTIIIDRADRFGLADLYQLRGRVGRSQMKAYAYLLLPRHLMIEAHARKRVSAIKQYSQLGAGFKVAMRDLEIRGAGSILGTEQSGHATAIGFELYCQLLKQTLARMKGQKVPQRVEVYVRLDFLPMSEDQGMDRGGAYIPRSYIEESRLRIEAYRRLVEANGEELQNLENQWRDRFGKLPLPVLQLLDVARIRLIAASLGINSVEVNDEKVMLQKGGNFIMVGNKFPRLNPEMESRQKLAELLRIMKSIGKR